MAWCRQAASHYLSQCWHGSLSPYDVTRPQYFRDYDRLTYLSQHHTQWWPGYARSKGLLRYNIGLISRNVLGVWILTFYNNFITWCRCTWGTWHQKFWYRNLWCWCVEIDSTINSEIWIHWNHDDVIRWKHFPRYWPFVRGIHRSSVNSPHKGPWGGALIFSLICVWMNGWVNNREAGDLRRHRAHYDVSVMMFKHGLRCYLIGGKLYVLV